MNFSFFNVMTKILGGTQGGAFKMVGVFFVDGFRRRSMFSPAPSWVQFFFSGYNREHSPLPQVFILI